MPQTRVPSTPSSNRITQIPAIASTYPPPTLSSLRPLPDTNIPEADSIQRPDGADTLSAGGHLFEEDNPGIDLAASTYHL